MILVKKLNYNQKKLFFKILLQLLSLKIKKNKNYKYNIIFYY